MIKLALTPDETEMLGDVLASELSDLRMEISHTDSMDYRDMLKTRKRVLQKVIDAIETERGAVAAG